MIVWTVIQNIQKIEMHFDISVNMEKTYLNDALVSKKYSLPGIYHVFNIKESN